MLQPCGRPSLDPQGVADVLAVGPRLHQAGRDEREHPHGRSVPGNPDRRVGGGEGRRPWPGGPRPTRPGARRPPWPAPGPDGRPSDRAVDSQASSTERAKASGSTMADAAGVVEVGQVADLVPHGPALGRCGPGPTAGPGPPGPPPPPEGRRTRRRGPPGGPAASSWCRGYGMGPTGRGPAAARIDSTGSSAGLQPHPLRTSTPPPPERTTRTVPRRRGRTSTWPVGARHGGEAEFGALPLVLVPHLGGSHLEPRSAPSTRWRDHRPLLLEGVAGGDPEVDGEGAGVEHDPTLPEGCDGRRSESGPVPDRGRLEYRASHPPGMIGP